MNVWHEDPDNHFSAKWLTKYSNDIDWIILLFHIILWCPFEKIDMKFLYITQSISLIDPTVICLFLEDDYTVSVIALEFSTMWDSSPSFLHPANNTYPDFLKLIAIHLWSYKL